MRHKPTFADKAALEQKAKNLEQQSQRLERHRIRRARVEASQRAEREHGESLDSVAQEMAKGFECKPLPSVLISTLDTKLFLRGA